MTLSAALAEKYGLIPEDEDAPVAAPKEKDSGEAFFDVYMAKLQDKSPAPEKTPDPIAEQAPEAEEEPSFIHRSVDRLRLATSDAINTALGDTYGRATNDPTEKTDWLGIDGISGERRLAIAADIATGVGDVFSDAFSTYTPDIIQEGLSKAVNWASENKAKHPIYGNAGLKQARSDLAEFSPRLAEVAGDALTVGSVIAPAKLPTPKALGAGVRGKLKLAKEKLRKSDIEKRWSPEKPFGAKDVDITEPGLLKTTTVTAKGQRKQMNDDLADIDGLDPRESPGNNIGVVEAEVDKLRKSLDKDLRFKDYMGGELVKADVDSAILEASKAPIMRGSVIASAASKAVYDEFKAILERHLVNGNIKPGALLDARRELDAWLKIMDPKVFVGESLSGTKSAITAIRTAINKRIIASEPSVSTKESLRRQSSLLTARDDLIPMANRQAGNRVSRALQRTQEKYGLAMPHSAAAVGANTELGPLILGSTLAVGANAGRGIKGVGRNVAGGLEKAVQQAYLGGRGPLTIAAVNKLQEEGEQ